MDGIDKSDRAKLLQRVQALRAGDDVKSARLVARIIDLRRDADGMAESEIQRELEQIERMRNAPAALGVIAPPTPPGTALTQQAFLAKETQPVAPQLSREPVSAGRNSRAGTAEADWQHVDDRQLARDEQEKRMYRDVRRDIRKLKPEYAKVMRLCLEGDYTFEQIAEKTGLSKATAWRYYKAAVQTLAINVDPERLEEIAAGGNPPLSDYEATIAPLEQSKSQEQADNVQREIASLIPAYYDDRAVGELELDEMTQLLAPTHPDVNVRPNWANQTERPKYVRRVTDPWLSTRAVDAGPDDSELKPVTSAGGAQAPGLVAARERRQRRHGPYHGEKRFSLENPAIMEDP